MITNTATPSWNSDLYKHYWRRRTFIQEYRTKVVPEYSQYTLVANSDYSGATIWYGDDYVIDQNTGYISLVNPQKTTLYYDTVQTAYVDKLVGKYAFFRDASVTSQPSATATDIFVIQSGYTISSDSTWKYASPAKALTSYFHEEYGEWEWLSSSDASEYPMNSVVDGYQYDYKGILFDNVRTAPKFITGSYTGTGTYGTINDPITLDIQTPTPIMVTIYAHGSPGFTNGLQGSNVNGNSILWTPSVSSIMNRTFKFKDTILSWYPVYNVDQYSSMNASNVTYEYIVIC